MLLAKRRKWMCKMIHFKWIFKYFELKSIQSTHPIDLHWSTHSTFNCFHFRLAHIAKGLIAFGIFSTHPIQCYVAIDILWTEYVSKMVRDSPRPLFWEYVMRAVIVFITCTSFFDVLAILLKQRWNVRLKWTCIELTLRNRSIYLIEFIFVVFAVILAILVPNLDLIINLVGALTLSTSGILFPAFLECIGKWRLTSGHAKAIMVAKNVIIGLIGLAGFVIGTTLSMKDIIKTYLDWAANNWSYWIKSFHSWNLDSTFFDFSIPITADNFYPNDYILNANDCNKR